MLLRVVLQTTWDLSRPLHSTLHRQAEGLLPGINDPFSKPAQRRSSMFGICEP